METSKAVALFVGIVVFALPVAYVASSSPAGPERGDAPSGLVRQVERTLFEDAPRGVNVPSAEALEDAASRPLRKVARQAKESKSARSDKGGDKGTERALRGTRTASRKAPSRKPRNGLAARAVDGPLFDAEGKRRLAPREVAFLLRDAGFPVQAIPRMVCTAKWESLYDTRAKNVNRHNGSHDTGLFQINDIWLEECSVTRAQLLDPVVNAQCAKKVFRNHGYWAWYGYRYKQDECKKFKLSDRTMVRLAAQ